EEDDLKKSDEGKPDSSKQNDPLPVLEKNSDPIRPFQFINAGNVHALAHLMVSLDPETIAMVVGYLSSDLATSLLSELDPEKKKTVLFQMAQARSLEPEKAKEFEKQIKDSLDYVFGGPQQVAEIISQMEEGEGQNWMTELEKNQPALAEKVKKFMFRFEDLFGLSDRDLRVLSQGVSYEDWACALAQSGNLARKFFELLPPESREVFRQHLSLLPANLNGKIGQKQAEVLKKARELHRKGLISLVKQNPGQGPAPASEPKVENFGYHPQGKNLKGIISPW
ncbi:MAG: hypothetical protein HY399_08025, partial [Elusimicrobia bacterium]|nr:hypothetical protein [Elusimicrobiota bacterium]